MTSDNSRHRLGLLAVAALSLFGALFARLWFLQIVEGDAARAEAAANTTRVVIIPAPRGRILDRNSVPLVENRESIVVGIDYQEFSELSKGKQASVKKRLSATLSAGRPVEEKVSVKLIGQRLNDSRYTHLRPVPVAEDISEEDEIYFAEQADSYPSVVVERTTVRSYPFGSLAAHLLGYVGPLSGDEWEELEKDNDKDKPYIQTDEIGRAGIESEYEEYLRGTPGQRVYEVDRQDRIVRELTARRVEPKAGDDLYLAVDARVQYKAEEALQAQLSTQFKGRPGKEAGALVVMDQSTGQVRAMASYPTYNPAELVGGISCPTWRNLQGLPPEGPCGKEMTAEINLLKEADDAPVPKLQNRAIQEAYNPASTFKLASSYAAIKAGIRQPQDYINDTGIERLCEGETKGCVKKNSGGGNGSINLSDAITVSSDVYFYKIGRQFWEGREKYGKTGFQDAVKELGFGDQTGIDLPAEREGSIPTPDDEMELALDLFEDDPEYYDNDIAVAKDAGRWNTGYSADMAIGQKLTATPLQNANAYAALANGGTLYVPSLLDKITAANEPTVVHRQYEKKAIRTIDFGTARQPLIHGFQGVIDPTGQSKSGTAVGTFVGFPFGSMPLAGKTGTAQTGNYKNNVARPDTSVFVGFTLGGTSNWTVAATLQYSGFGSDAAAPAARMVLEPIAKGTIDQFQVPLGGAIDAERAAEQSGIVGTGSD